MTPADDGPRADSREWILTALVVLETIGLFVLIPLGGRTHVPMGVNVVVGLVVVGTVIAVVWPSRFAIAAVLLAAAVEVAATVLRVGWPSERTEALDFAAGLLFLVALTGVVGYVVFGPGRVTPHRVLGAVVIYLNVAMAFALLDRLIESLVPGAFGPPARIGDVHSIATFVYFSLTTITTSGYGDIVPIDPFARSVTNLESVIGQLFPATLLARLITLELEHSRDRS